MTLTADRLRELLKYDPITGLFTWRASPGRRIRVGTIAGSFATKYVEIGVDGGCYRAHRLAWLYMTGAWPTEVDHRNENKHDNRWTNLRDASRMLNVLNQAKASSSKKSTDRRGVFRSASGRWFSRLKLRGRIYHLGTFDTQDEAEREYLRRREIAMEMVG